MSRSFWLSAAIERQRERQCSAKFLFLIFPLNPSISMSFTNQNGGSVPSVLCSPFFIWNGRCCLWQVTCLVKLSLLVALFFFSVYRVSSPFSESVFGMPCLALSSPVASTLAQKNPSPISSILEIHLRFVRASSLSVTSLSTERISKENKKKNKKKKKRKEKKRKEKKRKEETKPNCTKLNKLAVMS